MSAAPGVCTIVAAGARAVLDAEVERRLAELGPDAEVERFYAKAYGRRDKDELIDLVVHALDSASLFAPQRVVLVFDGGGLIREKRVQAWIEKPTPKTRLVLLHRLVKAKDKPPKPKAGLAVDVEELPSPRATPARRKWLAQRARAQGCSLAPEAFELLEEMVGEDLDVLCGEVDKLCLYRLEGEIGVADVEALIGRSAGRDFDRLLAALVAGRLGDALALKRAMEQEGFVTFGGGRIYGANAVSGALLPILLARLRKTGTLGAGGKQREALLASMKVNPWFGKKLAEEARRLGPRRLEVWQDAALAAEIGWKRSSHLRDSELLELLFAEMTRR